MRGKGRAGITVNPWPRRSGSSRMPVRPRHLPLGGFPSFRTRVSPNFHSRHRRLASRWMAATSGSTNRACCRSSHQATPTRALESSRRSAGPVGSDRAFVDFPYVGSRIHLIPASPPGHYARFMADGDSRPVGKDTGTARRRRRRSGRSSADEQLAGGWCPALQNWNAAAPRAVRSRG